MLGLGAVLFSQVASAALVLKIDNNEIFSFDANFYTHYGEVAGNVTQTGFSIEGQATNGSIFAPTDPEHYGFSLSADFGAEFSSAPYGLPSVSVVEQGVNVATSEWALSYSHDDINPFNSPFHSTLFGSLDLDPATLLTDVLNFRDDLGNDGPGGKQDRLDFNLTLNSDNIYHSVNLAEYPFAGELTISGSFFEQGLDAAGRNVWSTESTDIPEPLSVLLFSLGMTGLSLTRRNK